MKTAIKLALIYLAMQILGALAVGPFTMIYAYVKYGTVDRASEFALAPTLLAGFVFMLIYLWQKGYLTGKLFLYLYEAGQSVHLWNQISTQDGDSGQKKGRYIARKYLNGN